MPSAPALAGEVTIGQKGQKFSEESVSLKTGDTVKFMNDDNISHNVLSKGPGGNKNAGLQKAGDTTTITYDKAGDYEVDSNQEMVGMGVSNAAAGVFGFLAILLMKLFDFHRIG